MRIDKIPILSSDIRVRLRASNGDILDWDLGRVEWVTGRYGAISIINEKIYVYVIFLRYN